MSCSTEFSCRVHILSTANDTGEALCATGRPVEVWVLVAASFIIAVGFGIVAPVLPMYASSFDVGHTAVAALISAFAFVRLAFAPMSGKLVTASASLGCTSSGS